MIEKLKLPMSHDLVPFKEKKTVKMIIHEIFKDLAEKAKKIDVKQFTSGYFSFSFSFK